MNTATVTGPTATSWSGIALGFARTTLLWVAASYLLFIVVWEVAAWSIDNPVLLPSFGATVDAAVQLISSGILAADIIASLKRVVLGFAIAAAIAVPLAMVLAYFLILRRLIMPIVQLLRPIPPIAWIPLSVLWFGIGDPPSYFITAVAAFFPIFLNAFQGGISVEQRHFHAAQFLGAGQRALILRIMVPSAMPFIWTGVSVGLGQSWMAVVTAELIAAQSGLGYMIQNSRINLETASILVGMITIGLLGSLMVAGLRYLERYVLPWKVAN